MPNLERHDGKIVSYSFEVIVLSLCLYFQVRMVQMEMVDLLEIQRTMDEMLNVKFINIYWFWVLFAGSFLHFKFSI